MTDIAAFIAQRLDEDEAVARAATPGPWAVDDESYPESILNPEDHVVVGGGKWGGEAPVFDAEDAKHIARHDPARALLRVKAGRNLLARYSKTLSSVSEDIARVGEDSIEYAVGMGIIATFIATLHDKASEWADHADFDPGWSAVGSEGGTA